MGPAAQYLLERSNTKDGTVTATTVNVEVRTPTPTYEAELLEQEMKKTKHFKTSDTEVTIQTEHY